MARSEEIERELREFLDREDQPDVRKMFEGDSLRDDGGPELESPRDVQRERDNPEQRAREAFAPTGPMSENTDTLLRELIDAVRRLPIEIRNELVEG